MVGEVFLASLGVFPVMYVVGYAIENLLVRNDFGRAFNTIIKILLFIGVVAHELSHRLVCALTGVPAFNTSVKYRPIPHGSVTLKQRFQYTLLQGFLIGFAPLLIGAWAIYFLILAAFNPFFHPLVRILAGFSSFSILLALSPSRVDLSSIQEGFQNDPQHGLYQIFLVGLSFLLTWIVVVVYHLRFPFEFLYYFIIIFFYIILKYFFILLRVVIEKIRFRKGRPYHKIRYKRFARRRYGPKIPEKYH
ncbi:MAG: hypothetical protein ACFFCI_10180 [Promethearchaeota archaeon]